ncbi:hypothetical protein NDU88_003225 [Pleurodeles waltl]|uniref:Uncharacterized protein n=1 Tax=Pleurodeles waltl TaxID=8319 RepID=A0AAV7QBJ5_PLEWA|nr:hypothetical protein NDU88_003225 [Pleurodeles waltl]
MQFLDSSVQGKKKKKKPDKPRSARFTAPLRDGHLGASTPSTPPRRQNRGGGREKKAGRVRPRSTVRPFLAVWPSGWPHRNGRLGRRSRLCRGEIRAS